MSGRLLKRASQDVVKPRAGGGSVAHQSGGAEKVNHECLEILTTLILLITLVVNHLGRDLDATKLT